MTDTKRATRAAPEAPTASGVTQSDGHGIADQSHENVTGTSNSGSPVTSPPLKLTLAVLAVDDATHCASAGVQPVHVAPRKTLLSLNRMRTVPMIGDAGRSLIELAAQVDQAASVPWSVRSLALYPLADFGAPSVARHVAGLKAGDAGAGAGKGGGDGAGAAVG